MFESPNVNLQAGKLATKASVRGFTLIEVMLATAFFLAVIAAILNLQVKSAQQMSDSRDFERGVNLLNDIAELLQVLPADKVQQVTDNKAGVAFAQNGAPLPQSDPRVFYRLYADMVPAVATLKQINLLVQWEQRTEKRSIKSNLLVNLP